MTVAGAILAVVAIVLPTAALAHEKRVVGKYTFVVGFLGEPAIQGQPNGLDLTITDANGNPVQGAEKTLKVAIAYSGGTPKDLPLTARFGLPGKYTADVIPTKVGTYSFSFSGTLNGDPVNQTFESGPGRFDDVASATSLEFPVAVPATADLAQQTQAANDVAQAAMQRATLFGLGGIAVGLIGIVLAVVALLMRARPTSASADVETTTAPSAQRS
jgi:hypothetical protein